MLLAVNRSPTADARPLPSPRQVLAAYNILSAPVSDAATGEYVGMLDVADVLSGVVRGARAVPHAAAPPRRRPWLPTACRRVHRAPVQHPCILGI